MRVTRGLKLIGNYVAMVADKQKGKAPAVPRDAGRAFSLEGVWKPTSRSNIEGREFVAGWNMMQARTRSCLPLVSVES